MEDPTTPGGQSSSASFRESDIEFLRTQAREWLEAVLDEKLDASVSLEDLLADGTILYRVSQIIREDGKFPGRVESSPLPSVSASPEMSRKNSMKYQPYPYVEAFLKVCKEVGLVDVDVFNPNDAVDKKDIRRVCVCLRRLSKKSRTLNIQVPDFDNVKHTLSTPTHKHSMPTDMVHGLRDSIEQSSNKTATRTSANGNVSKETSSSIADLRKEDSELDGVNLEPSVKSETYHKVHQDLDAAAEHRDPVVTESNYKVKAAEPGVDTLPLADEHALNEENDRAAKRSAEKTAHAVTAVAVEPLSQPANAPSKPKPQEKPQTKPIDEGQKGQFIAKPDVYSHDGSKESRKGGFPWAPLLAGAVAVIGGIVGIVVVRERRRTPVTNVYDGEIYEVQPGDTLTKIARKSGKSHWREIVQQNSSIGNPDLIYPGDRLKL